MAADHEKLFQKTFIKGLQKNGWTYSGSEGCPDYDKGSAVIPSDVRQWLISSQKKSWDRLVAKAGGEDLALNRVIDALNAFRKKYPNARDNKGGGTYNLFLRGLVVDGITFQFFQNKPVSAKSPAASWKLYNEMSFRVVSELYYSALRPHDSIDLAFFLNGIPLGTAELKNILGGQGVSHAEKQYKKSRKPKGEPLLHPSAGALFHIAADNSLASLTTALNNEATHFIPFNTGSDNTEWQSANAADRYAVSYLWKDVLKKDNLCQIIFTMMRNVEVDGICQTRFPRYHQFDNLRKILESVASDEGDKNYLSQHAPGSGKSDEIANLAYALSNLQTDDAGHTYSKVIVITNRTVLDRQIRDLLKSKMLDGAHYRHITGAENSSKSKVLADELLSRGGARILGVTAQTFSGTLLAAVRELRGAGKALSGRFAVIVDEAHDGETGRQHQNMYRALLGVSLDTMNAEMVGNDDAACVANTVDEPEHTSEEERRLLPSLNFFAYTATPNHDALRVFGEATDDGVGMKRYKPFHTYSMKQAREEGYINDVLGNYVTYDRFMNIEIDGTKYEGDRIVDFMAGRHQIGQWLQTQPEVKRDIVGIVMDKMGSLVIPSVNGEGKAMLTCASRLDAVIYKHMIDAEIAKLPKEKQFGTLVAFSGSVSDPVLDREVTELDRELNQNLTRNDIAEQFKDNTFRLLIAANKYQVGFDQPKLVCMFIDKPLKGINLVQTTARVNRKIKGKDQVYIFDFTNDREDVKQAFSEFDLEASLSLDLDVSTATLDNLIENANAAGIHSSGQPSEGSSTTPVDDVEEFTKARIAYESQSDEQLRAQASALMGTIIGRCTAKFNSEMADENLTPDREEELRRYRIALKQFVSVYNRLSITQQGADAAKALYATYGAYDLFFASLAIALSLNRDEDTTHVDVNALRLEKYKIVESGRVERDSDGVAVETISSYGGSLDPAFHMSKIGPVEALINEINGYSEFIGQSGTDDVKNFVEALVVEMKNDTELRRRAANNNEDAFVNSSRVEGIIIGLLHKTQKQSDNPDEKMVAKEIIKKKESDKDVVVTLARTLHQLIC